MGALASASLSPSQLPRHAVLGRQFSRLGLSSSLYSLIVFCPFGSLRRGQVLQAVGRILLSGCTKNPSC